MRRNILFLWIVLALAGAQAESSRDWTITSLAISPNDRWLALTSEVTDEPGYRLLLWDLSSRKLTRTVDSTSDSEVVAFSLDNKRVLVGGSKGIETWETESGKLLQEASFKFPVEAPAAKAFSPDGSLFAGVHWDDKLRVWDVNTGKVLREYPDDTVVSQTLAFSPDSRFLARGELFNPRDPSSEGKGSVILLEDLRGKSEPRVWKREYSGLSFSPDGKFVACIRHSVFLTEVVTGKLARQLKAGGGELSFSPDGKKIAADSNGRLSVLDLGSGEEIYRLEVGNSQCHTRFTNDGKVLVTGWEGVLQFWNASSGEEIGRFDLGAKL